MGEDDVQVFSFEQGAMSVMAAAGQNSKAAVEILSELGQIGIASLDIRNTLQRSSFTRRSCRVWLARSMRPLAWGVLAQMIWMSSSCIARPNWVRPLPSPKGRA